VNEQVKLREIVQKHPLIIGIGNPLRGDDAAGIELVQRLQAQGYPHTLIVESNPENYLQRIAGMPGEVRLWVDIVNFAGEPGSWRIFSHSEIGHFAISTHNFSLELIFDFLHALRPVPDFCLGIQPEQTALGASLSPVVRKTIGELTQLIGTIWENG
jgi:hydrogenase maturation protease